jgi:hypothetical protein
MVLPRLLSSAGITVLWTQGSGAAVGRLRERRVMLPDVTRLTRLAASVREGGEPAAVGHSGRDAEHWPTGAAGALLNAYSSAPRGIRMMPEAMPDQRLRSFLRSACWRDP